MELQSQLKIGPEDYYRIVNNIRRIGSISEFSWDRILEIAERELPSETRTRCERLLITMENDDEIYPPGSRYSKGLGKRLKTAVADYLLRHKELTNQNP